MTIKSDSLFLVFLMQSCYALSGRRSPILETQTGDFVRLIRKIFVAIGKFAFYYFLGIVEIYTNRIPVNNCWLVSAIIAFPVTVVDCWITWRKKGNKKS